MIETTATGSTPNDATEKERVLTVDIRDFRSGDPAKKAAFIRALSTSLKDLGFLIVRGHAISESQQKAVYEKIGHFFKLPTETKQKYEVKGTGGARGYTPFGREHAKNTKVGDLKEFFHVGVKVPETHPLAQEYPPNVSVGEIPGFDESMRAIYDDLLELGMDLLRGIATVLKLEENYFDEKVRYGNSILRAIHYPPLTGQEEYRAVRASAHEDINLITLLIGASSPGLQVMSVGGEWVPVTCNPFEIVVNVGDMLQRLTNHVLKSTTHQVVNPPPGEATSNVRFSMPFFLHPVSDMSLKALPSCVSPQNPQKEPETTAGEYLAERLREIGLS